MMDTLMLLLGIGGVSAAAASTIANMPKRPDTATVVPGTGEKMHDALGTAIDLLPEGSAFQFLLYMGSDIHDTVDGWIKQKKPANGMCRDIIRSYAEFLEQMRHRHISRNFTAPVRNIRLLFSVKYGGKEKSSSTFSAESLLSFMKSADRETSDRYLLKKRYGELAKVKQRLIGSLNAGGDCGLILGEIDGDEGVS